MTPDAAVLGPELAAEVEKVASIIATARRMLSEHRLVDVTNLDGKVRSLCELALGAPRQHRDAAARVLRAIIDNLDRLEEELRLQSEAFQPNTEPGDTTAGRRQAVDAYSKIKDGQ